MADDIAYSTYDLEDSLKAGFITPSDILPSTDTLLEQVASKVSVELKRPFAKADVLRVFTGLFSSGEALRPTESGTERFIERFRAYRDGSYHPEKARCDRSRSVNRLVEVTQAMEDAGIEILRRESEFPIRIREVEAYIVDAIFRAMVAADQSTKEAAEGHDVRAD